jgi:hypothetical protein
MASLNLSGTVTVPPVINITIEASMSPSAFTSTAGSISSRVRSSPVVSWTPNHWPAQSLWSFLLIFKELICLVLAGVDQRTPDLSSLLNTVISQVSDIQVNYIY